MMIDDWAGDRYNSTNGVVKSREAGSMSILEALVWAARPS